MDTCTESETSPWWEVDLERLYAIGEAIVHKGLNDDFLDPSDLSIILYDDINMNTIVFRHYGASPDDVTHVTIPIGTVASRKCKARVVSSCLSL